jgi:hypothetical protein
VCRRLHLRTKLQLVSTSTAITNAKPGQNVSRIDCIRYLGGADGVGKGPVRSGAGGGGITAGAGRLVSGRHSGSRSASGAIRTAGLGGGTTGALQVAGSPVSGIALPVI